MDEKNSSIEIPLKFSKDSADTNLERLTPPRPRQTRVEGAHPAGTRDGQSRRFEATVLPRIHLAFRQFIRPVAPSREGSSFKAGQKPHVDENREEESSRTDSESPADGEEKSERHELAKLADSNLEKKETESDEEPKPERKLEIWNPQKLISLLKAIVSNEELHQQHQGAVTYGELRNNRQSGVQFRKGAVIDRKAG